MSRLVSTLQTTLAIIKPDAVKYSKEILQAIMKNGFQILQRQKFQLSPEQAAEFYVDFEKFKCFVLLVLNLSNGPIEAVILTKRNAVCDFLQVIGPERPSEARQCNPNCLRALFGDCADDYKNAIHGSMDSCKAEREIHFFFPNFIIEPISWKEGTKLCTRRDIMDVLIEALHKLTKEKPNDPIEWLAEWLLENNPNLPVICDSVSKAKICKAKPPEQVALPECCLYKTIDKNVKQPVPEEYEKKTVTDMLCHCRENRVEIIPADSLICPFCNKYIDYSIPIECGQGVYKKCFMTRQDGSPVQSIFSSTTSSSVKFDCDGFDSGNTQ